MESVIAVRTNTAARRASFTMLRRRYSSATPIGRAVIDRLLETSKTRQEAAGELDIALITLGKLLWKRRRWARPLTRRALTAFLGCTVGHVEVLLREGGGRPRSHQREVTCTYCGVTFTRSREHVKRNRRRRHFCKHEHYGLWRKGRRRAPSLPPDGRRSGRHLQRVQRIEGEPSNVAVAMETGLAEHTVRLARTGQVEPTPFTRYCLERVELSPRQLRPLLSEAILNHCFTHKLKPAYLAKRAGLNERGLAWVIREGRATRPTLRKLAAAMGCRFTDLKWLSLPVLRGQTFAKHSQRLGRPPTFTDADALDVWQWRSEASPIAWAEIGRRKGWPVKKRDCPMAHRAYKRARSLRA